MGLLALQEQHASVGVSSSLVSAVYRGRNSERRSIRNNSVLGTGMEMSVTPRSYNPVESHAAVMYYSRTDSKAAIDIP
jgi:hypothetical protein